jgi:anti-sigma B factor antagonist
VSTPRPSLEIRSYNAGPREHTLHLSGELDLASAGQLETTIAELCADGAREVLLEMSELSFMDSTGLRSLLVSHELCVVNACRLVLGELSPQVERLLDLSGVDGRLPRAGRPDS